MNGYNILVLDEDLHTLKAIKKILENDYNIIACEDAYSALEAIKKTEIHLIITEQTKKSMPVLDFLQEAEKLNPETVKIILTNYADAELLLEIINNSKLYKYILKPLDANELKLTVRTAIETYNLSVENKRLSQKLKENYSKTIMMLANALEARDSFLQGHSERVAYASKCIARRIGISEREIELLYSACLLHDIGKIGIPENVLKKTDKLDADDLLYIKAHTDIAVRFLSEVPDFAEMIPIIKHHHERIDGKGYPDGIKGDEIPLFARIIAVADTFDALTSNRPYRQGKSFDEAVKILEEVKETQLDAKIVDLFIKMLKEKEVTSVWELE